MRMAARWRRTTLHAVVAALFGFGCMAPASAETRAVVVGIDDYLNVPKLKGARADAEDIAATLQKGGVKDLVLLRDGEATRRDVLGAIDQLIEKSRKGDLAIITLAGHGAR